MKTEGKDEEKEKRGKEEARVGWEGNEALDKRLGLAGQGRQRDGDGVCWPHTPAPVGASKKGVPPSSARKKSFVRTPGVAVPGAPVPAPFPPALKAGDPAPGVADSGDMAPPVPGPPGVAVPLGVAVPGPPGVAVPAGVAVPGVADIAPCFWKQAK